MQICHSLISGEAYLIEKVDLGDSVARITRVLEKEGDESYKCVQCVKTLDPYSCCIMSRLRERPIAEVNAHLRAQTKKSRYQVIGLENSL